MISKYHPEYVRAQKLFVDWCKFTSLSSAIETAIHYSDNNVGLSEEFKQGLHDAIWRRYSPCLYQYLNGGETI